MNGAEEVLRDIGWGKNEAACYCALVEYGEMKASDISTIVDISSSKVYPEMQKLVNRGYVREKGEPKRYAAQNPRYVIREEQADFNDQLSEVEQELQEAWEIQEDSSPPSEDHAWVLSGRKGMNTQLARLIDLAEDSVYGFDERLPVTTPETFDELVKRIEGGLDVRIVGRSSATERLDRLQSAGADVRVMNDTRKTTFYVADSQHILFNADNGKSTVVFKDGFIGSVMMEEFEDIHENGDVINNEA